VVRPSKQEYRFLAPEQITPTLLVSVPQLGSGSHAARHKLTHQPVPRRAIAWATVVFPDPLLPTTEIRCIP
jgi:hypothetical protein